MRRRKAGDHAMSVCYDGGIRRETDRQVLAVAEALGGQLVGSGCWTMDRQTRDLQLVFPSAQSRTTARARMGRLRLGLRLKNYGLGG